MRKPPSQPAFDMALLLERGADGDREAEATLVAYFRPRVLTFFRMRMHDPETAEELCHDVLLAVVHKLRQGPLRITESLSNYVFGITRNVWNDHLTQRMKAGAGPFPDGFDVPAPAVEASVIDRHALALTAINQLEKVDRQILSLTLVEGMKPAQIAERLQLSCDVVRQRKVRAVKKLSLVLSKASQTEVGSD